MRGLGTASYSVCYPFYHRVTNPYNVYPYSVYGWSCESDW